MELLLSNGGRKASDWIVFVALVLALAPLRFQMHYSTHQFHRDRGIVDCIPHWGIAHGPRVTGFLFVEMGSGFYLCFEKLEADFESGRKVLSLGKMKPLDKEESMRLQNGEKRTAPRDWWPIAAPS